MKYSIWIIPPEPIYSNLKSVVFNLANKYDGPTFEPHMTLLGNIDMNIDEIEKRIKELVTNLDKFEVSLGVVSFSTTYFQSVFVRVNSNAKLMQLNLDAKKKFVMTNDVFMPHMSLLYGEHDMASREAAANDVVIQPKSFVVDRLIVTPATLDPTEWEHSATIQLKNLY